MTKMIRIPKRLEKRAIEFAEHDIDANASHLPKQCRKLIALWRATLKLAESTTSALS